MILNLERQKIYNFIGHGLAPDQSRRLAIASSDSGPVPYDRMISEWNLHGIAFW